MIQLQRLARTDDIADLSHKEVEYRKSLISGKARYADSYKEIKALLLAETSGKCMYCESKITHVYAGDVEHIKPKAVFPADRLSYPNLGVACWQCNHAKGDEYDANCEIINPYIEDPGQHLVFLGPIIRHRPGSARGEYTVALLKLNDSKERDLPRRRQQLLDKVARLIDLHHGASNDIFRRAYAREIDDMLANCGEFSAAVTECAKRLGYP